MTSAAHAAESFIIRYSPFYRAAQRLRVATALRREALPAKDLMSCWRGVGVFYFVVNLDDTRFFPLRAPASRPVRAGLVVAATLAQAAVSLSVAPYCGVLVGVSYLRGGREAAHEQAARHFLPLYVGLGACHAAQWVLLMHLSSRLLGLALKFPPPPPSR